MYRLAPEHHLPLREYEEYLREMQIEGLRHEKKYGRDIGELKFIQDDFERHKERFRDELVGIVKEHTADQVNFQTEMLGAAYRQEMAKKDKDKETAEQNMERIRMEKMELEGKIHD